MNNRLDDRSNRAIIQTPIEERYLNVPINLLQGIFKDTTDAVKNIGFFCAYQHANDRISHEPIGVAVTMAVKFFNFDTRYNEHILFYGKQLYEDWIKNNNPRGGIKLKIFANLEIKENSEFDKIIFCAIVALKSIIQRADFKKTTFDTLFARMAGFSSSKLAEGKIPDVIQKYMSRHYRTKIIKTLEDHWHFAYEADHTRGFYFSFILNHESLCHSIQKKKHLKNLVKRKKNELKIQTRKKVRDIYKNILESQTGMTDKIQGSV